MPPTSCLTTTNRYKSTGKAIFMSSYFDRSKHVDRPKLDGLKARDGRTV